MERIYKGYENYLPPYIESRVDAYNYRMEKIWFIPNSFLKYLVDDDMPNSRCWGGEVINGDVYEKLHIVS